MNAKHTKKAHGSGSIRLIAKKKKSKKKNNNVLDLRYMEVSQLT